MAIINTVVNSTGIAGSTEDMKKKKKKAIWENTAKEQPYLMPGTPEYEERQEDLKLHDPFRPDDEFHVQLEERNESHAEDLRDANKEHTEENKGGGKHNYEVSIRKDTQFSQLKKEAAEAARATKTLADDAKAHRLTPEQVEAMVNDNGVTESEYIPKAIRKYIE